MSEHIKNKNIIKYIFIATVVVFAFPSILYMFCGNGLVNIKSEFNFLLKDTKIKEINTILFSILFLLISVLYFKIIKQSNKIFKSMINVFIFIILISIIFTVVLPFTSTDIYYYMSTGWSESHYNVNPYYTSVSELKTNGLIEENDEIIAKMPQIWEKTTIVYGPLWPLICKFLTSMSGGSLEICLMIFKIFNLIIHILNCFIISKIVNKKKIVLIYGLNPLILFEALSNVHNDIVVVFFILLAVYFIKKKRQIIPAVIMLALGATLKYYTVLLAPFMVLYYYKDYKMWKKILYSLALALIFIITVIIFYLIYAKNIEILRGLIVQQEKITKSIYLIIAMYPTMKPSRGFLVSKIATKVFIVLYIIFVLITLFKNNSKWRFSNYIRKYNIVLVIFIFFIITNFQTWYIMWLIPTFMYLKAKTINSLLQLTVIAEISNVVFFAINEHYSVGVWYILTMVILFSVIKIYSIIDKRYIKRNYISKGES